MVMISGGILNEMQERHGDKKNREKASKKATRTKKPTPRTPTIRSRTPATPVLLAVCIAGECWSVRCGRRSQEVEQNGTEARATRAGAEQEGRTGSETGADERGQVQVQHGTGTGTGSGDAGTGS